MDVDTAHEIDQNIRDNEARIVNLTVIDAESSMFARKLYMSPLKSIESYIKNLTEFNRDLNGSQAVVDFKMIEIGVIMRTISLEHKFITIQILRYLEEIVYGKISEWIFVETLKNDLTNLENTLKLKNGTLPILTEYENNFSIFKYSATRASIYRERMMIEIAVPVIRKDLYLAYVNNTNS